jgi:hypothetical protein
MSALVRSGLVHASAKYVASDDYPIGIPREIAEALLAQVDQLWGTDAMAAMFVPSRVGDERFGRWWAKLLRTGASPRAAQALLRAATEGDTRPLLPLIDGTFSSSPSSMLATWSSISLARGSSNFPELICRLSGIRLSLSST